MLEEEVVELPDDELESLDELELLAVEVELLLAVDALSLEPESLFLASPGLADA